MIRFFALCVVASPLLYILGFIALDFLLVPAIDFVQRITHRRGRR